MAKKKAKKTSKKKAVVKKPAPTERPVSAFVLSLLAGVLISVGGVVLGMLSAFLSARIGKIMIGESSYITLAGIAYPLAGLQIILGVLVMLASIIIFLSAAQRTAWSIIILVISILALMLNIFPPGPIGLVGAIMGILGGALALSWRPTKG
jgi:hypothetical protein